VYEAHVWGVLMPPRPLFTISFILCTDNFFYLVFALIISLGQATVYVLTGLYGQPSDLSAGISLLSVAADLLGAIGSGMGILMAVTSSS
jgi:hypothetical protein